MKKRNAPSITDMVLIDSFSITFCSKLILATWASFSAWITAFFRSVSASFSTTFWSSRAINNFVFSASLHQSRKNNNKKYNIMQNRSLFSLSRRAFFQPPPGYGNHLHKTIQQNRFSILLTLAHSFSESFQEFWAWWHAHREYADPGRARWDLPARLSSNSHQFDQTDQCKPTHEKIKIKTTFKKIEQNSWTKNLNNLLQSMDTAELVELMVNFVVYQSLVIISCVILDNFIHTWSTENVDYLKMMK